MRCEFTCPKCGSHRLDEVMGNVTVYSQVSLVEIDENEMELSYGGDQSNEDGEVERYQCASCGEVIAYNEEELKDYFLEKIEEKKVNQA